MHLYSVLLILLKACTGKISTVCKCKVNHGRNNMNYKIVLTDCTVFDKAAKFDKTLSVYSNLGMLVF